MWNAGIEGLRARCQPAGAQAAASRRSDRAGGAHDAAREAAGRHALVVRKLARAVGLSHSSVQRIWAAHGLKPHLTKTFKLSNDPQFGEKVQDIVGLYLDPPDKALVLVRRREEPDPGARPHAAGAAAEEGPRRHHDARLQAPRHHDAVRRPRRRHRRGDRPCMKRHRHQEWLKFLRDIDRATPKRARSASHRRQLCHPQASQGQGVARQASALPLALHPDLRLLAQPGRALLRPDHRGSHPARRLPQRR